jgi:hypothetical protein
MALTASGATSDCISVPLIASIAAYLKAVLAALIYLNANALTYHAPSTPHTRTPHTHLAGTPHILGGVHFNQAGGRVKAIYNPAKARTGRFSVSSPSLQMVNRSTTVCSALLCSALLCSAHCSLCGVALSSLIMMDLI